MNALVTLLVLLAACGSVYAQGPSDTNNTVPGTPTTSPPISTPTTKPPFGVPTTIPPFGVPTPTTKKTTIGESSSSSDGELTPTPTPTTKTPKPVTTPPAANEAAVPAATTTAPPDINVDRSSKTEYGTRTPTSGNDTTAAVTTETAVSKMGSWLVPAVIGGVIVIALVFMTFFVRSRRDGENDYTHTPRGTDLFFAQQRTNTNPAANVAVLGDPIQPARERNPTSMRAGPLSPRTKKTLASPESDDRQRLTSPDFGTYKQKPMEGSSVLF